MDDPLAVWIWGKSAKEDNGVKILELEDIWLQQPESKNHEEVPEVVDKAEEVDVPERSCRIIDSTSERVKLGAEEDAGDG